MSLLITLKNKVGHSTIWKISSHVFYAFENAIENIYIDQTFLLHYIKCKNITEEASSNLQIIEHKTYSQHIQEVYELSGRHSILQPEYMKSRFDNGLLFYEIYEDNELAATTWLNPGSRRFLDEAGYFTTALENSIWFRDIFILKQFRGKNLYARVVATIVKQNYPNATQLWSSILADNKSSLRAANKLGYKQVTSLRTIHIFNRILLRLPEQNLTSFFKISGYKYPEKLIFTGKAFWLYIQKNMT